MIMISGAMQQEVGTAILHCQLIVPSVESLVESPPFLANGGLAKSSAVGGGPPERTTTMYHCHLLVAPRIHVQGTKTQSG
jgi:hypothetical protein